MLNEAPAVPYRTQSIPQITLTCVACAKTYEADAGTSPGRCNVCHAMFVAANQAESARLYAASQRGTHRHRRNEKIAGIALTVIVLGVVGAFRIVKREAIKEDTRAASGIRARPDVDDTQFLQAAETFATTMCACPDLACAAAVDRKFDQWTRTSDAPTSDVIRDRAEAQIARTNACHDTLRAR